MDGSLAALPKISFNNPWDGPVRGAASLIESGVGDHGHWDGGVG